MTLANPSFVQQRSPTSRKRAIASGLIAWMIGLVLAMTLFAQTANAANVISVTRQYCKTQNIYKDFHRYRSAIATSSRSESVPTMCNDENVLGWCFDSPVKGSKPFILRDASPIFDLLNSTTTMCHTLPGTHELVSIMGAGTRAETQRNAIGQTTKMGYVDFVYNTAKSGEIAGLVGAGWDPQGRVGALYASKEAAQKALNDEAAKSTDIEVTEALISVKDMVFTDRTEHVFIARGCVKNAGTQPLAIQVSMLAGPNGKPLEQFNSQIASNVAPGATQCTTANIAESYVAQNCTTLKIVGRPYNSGIADTDASDNQKFTGKCRAEKVTLRGASAPTSALPVPGALGASVAAAAANAQLPAPAIALSGKWTWQLPLLVAGQTFKQSTILMRASLTDNTGKAWDMTKLAPKNATYLEVLSRPHTPFSAKPAYSAPQKVPMAANQLINGTTWNIGVGTCTDYKLRIDTEDGATQTANVSATIAPSAWIEFTAGSQCK
jgi:hypothetical protein